MCGFVLAAMREEETQGGLLLLEGRQTLNFFANFP